MLRAIGLNVRSVVNTDSVRRLASVAATTKKNNLNNKPFPTSADVVIIGGGSIGCHTLYYLAKRGIRAVLLERSKLTSGTTWHTGGLIWRLRPSDVDIELLARSTALMNSLEAESGHDPGFINNGGLFIAHNRTRLDEYKRLATVGRALGIENQVLTAAEIQKDIFPLLNADAFLGGLFSPTDGVVDPAMLCTSLTRAAALRHPAGVQVHEDAEVHEILTSVGMLGNRIVTGVRTSHGTISTSAVLNATGVWGRELIEPLGLQLPLIPMRHAYIVSEPMEGIRDMPNVRDHDASVYFRIQGSSILMGGYESNPILLDRVPKDFSFQLYDLDWSTFDEHVKYTDALCPAFSRAGIKSTVCGPESFTPDHRPLMGPDPRLDGLFHSCGFNSAGMMFGGGCGEQMAHWIEHGRPELNMFAFDVRRFVPKQLANNSWATERSHEAYAKNYSMVFANDQPLAGRNLMCDPLHETLVDAGAFMEEKQGWERPGYYVTDGRRLPTLPYDYYGHYGHPKHVDYEYEKQLLGDCQYGISEHNAIIQQEALNCRQNAALFDISYYSKIYLTGPDAQRAADWIFTSDTRKDVNKVVYTCALNNAGGVESDLTVTAIDSASVAGQQHVPNFEGIGYFIVAGGASANHTFAHLTAASRELGLNVQLDDVTEKMGVLSVQGPQSRAILQQLTPSLELTDANLPLYGSTMLTIETPDTGSIVVRAMRISFVGELGYELYVPADKCVSVYKALHAVGKPLGLANAGYRAFYSLSHEKGYHLWNFDVRMDDTPLEANLGFVCRRTATPASNTGKPIDAYKGQSAIERQRADGLRKRLVTLELDDHVPLWGLEGVYRDGVAVGYLRRADYAYSLGKMLGRAYIRRSCGSLITNDYLKSGSYEVDVMGTRHAARLRLRSSFDPENRRLHGDYAG